MATVNAGSAAPLNMNALQLASLQYGNVPVYDAGLVRVDDGGGRFVDFRGSFAFATAPPADGGMGGGMDPYGYGYSYDVAAAAPDPNAYYPVSGTVAQITEVEPGGVSMDVTGLSLDAPTLFNMLRASDVAGVLSMVFAGNDAVTGSGGDDWLDGYGGDDNIQGGLGADFIRGLEGGDAIDGGGGNDDVNGNVGTDVVHGGDGDDVVRGGRDNDVVWGDAGNDAHVNGNIGDDEVHGGGGDDTVFGGQDNDRLFGDDGNDALSGDLGADTLTGGAGADRFLFRLGAGVDVVTDFNPAEGDRVQLATGVNFTLTTVNGQAAIDLGADQIVLMGQSQASADWVVTV
jgi:Ca2+-binding RTX toxin-like protein